MKTHISPEVVLQRLLAGSKNAKHKEVLRVLHEVCAGQAATSRDFSRATLRRLIDARGGFSGRILYNVASSDLHELVDAWRESVGEVESAEVGAMPQPHGKLLLRIQDVAVRSVVQARLAELERARQEIALLKSQLNIHVDMRPPATPIGHTSQAADLLSPSERDALAASIAPGTLSLEGWTVGVHGEVRNKDGRPIFRPGFAQAIRKTLARNGT